jgi:hypothetical protein
VPTTTPRTGQHARRSLARDAVEQDAGRLDREVHARIGQHLPRDRLTVAVVPGDHPVLVDDVGKVGPRRDAHHAREPHG